MQQGNQNLTKHFTLTFSTYYAINRKAAAKTMGLMYFVVLLCIINHGIACGIVNRLAMYIALLVSTAWTLFWQFCTFNIVALMIHVIHHTKIDVQLMLCKCKEN